MRKTRIYFPETLSVGATLTLNDNAFQHLVNVLRLKLGAGIALFNGDGYDYHASIVAIEKKSATVVVQNRRANLTKPKLNIHLAQSICRGEKMDFVVQKAVELGVTTITPLFSEFGNVRLAGDRLAKKIEHWQKVANSACEQSGRADVVKINPAQLFDDFLQTPLAGEKFILCPAALTVSSNQQLIESVTLLVGPEGGFSKAEVDAANAAGFMEWQLGNRVLRSETAGLAAIAVAQARWGDF